MIEAIPITEARKLFLTLVQEVAAGNRKVLLTRHGRPAAVLLSADEYYQMTETLDLLMKSEQVQALTQSLASVGDRGGKA